MKIFLNKQKTYNFNNKDFSICLKDIKKDKSDKVQSIVWVGIYIILFIVGVVSTKWLINGLVGMGTSQIVKWLIK
jgi:hypothetical protein